MPFLNELIRFQDGSSWVDPYFSNKFFFFFFQLQKQINDNLFRENE